MKYKKSPNQIIQELRSRRKDYINVRKKTHSGPNNVTIKRQNNQNNVSRRRIRLRPTRGQNNTNTRLRLSNLSPKTTNSDLLSLFEKIGPLKRCGIHWDSLGQSKGTADIEYFNESHAKRAVSFFQLNTYLHGRNIDISYINDADSPRKKFPLNRGIRHRQSSFTPRNKSNGVYFKQRRGNSQPPQHRRRFFKKMRSPNKSNY